MVPTFNINLVSNEDYARDFVLRVGNEQSSEPFDLSGASIRLAFVNAKDGGLIALLDTESIAPFGSRIEIFPGGRFGLRIVPFDRKYTRADRPEQRTVLFDCLMVRDGLTKRLFSGRLTYKWGSTPSVPVRA